MTKSTFNRRRFLGTAAMTGAALASPVYLRHAKAAGGEVNIWTYNDFVPKAFKDQFEAETGIKVNIRLVDDQGKQFNLLQLGEHQPHFLRKRLVDDQRLVRRGFELIRALLDSV